MIASRSKKKKTSGSAWFRLLKSRQRVRAIASNSDLKHDRRRVEVLIERVLLVEVVRRVFEGEPQVLAFDKVIKAVAGPGYLLIKDPAQLCELPLFITAEDLQL